VRFKNPYRNDEPPLSDQEIKEKEKNKIKFQFLDSNGNTLLEIRAFDNSKLLAAKGTILNLTSFSKNLVKRFRDLRYGKILH
jgi:hypothetical protein